MFLLQILYLFKYDNLSQSKHVRRNHFITCPDYILQHKHNFVFHPFILPVLVPQNDFLYSHSVHNTESKYKLKEQTMVRAVFKAERKPIITVAKEENPSTFSLKIF
jgi:hypothetical protein